MIEELIVTQGPQSAPCFGRLSRKRPGFGRTPFHEAYHRRERERPVLISIRRGIFGTEISVDLQFILLEVRTELERLLARPAAPAATTSQR